MSNAKRQEMIDDRADQTNGDDYTDALSVSSAVNDEVETSAVGSREIGPMEQLTDVTVDEDRFLQWLQVLDMQVIGACRADERLKPLLKSNASSGIAEDRLLAHLSQYFEPSEVCMLARCFCIPLVSVRVGKINKQGTVLCPISVRGNLSLTILPTSNLRLAFTGDDGHTERLFTLSSESECSAVVIDEIPADNSGRSFLIKSPDGRDVYFWCSEKSKLLGIELIAKMRDLITRKPTISELTGISELRLGYLATHLRAYLVGSSLTNARASCSSSLASSYTAFHLSDSAPNAQYSSTSVKSLRYRHSGSQALKANSVYQGSLSPRSNSFKEGMPRNLYSVRSAAREKMRRRGDGYLSPADNLTVTSPVTTNELCSNQSETEDIPKAKSCQLSTSFLESLGKLAVPQIPSLATQVPSISSPLFSPYYCWCPLGASSLPYPAAPSELPPNLPSESPSVPSLSSLLSANGSSGLLKPTPPCSIADIPSWDFPAFLPDPLVRLQVPSSQQIPTFTPLICEPIVHVPVIDICSSGQGYLVSAGPAMSTTIPPLHPKLVNPLIPENNSVVENGARETLRLLISSSSQTNPPMMDVLPAVLTSANETQNMLVAGSRGLYCGTIDVNAIGKSIALVSLSENSTVGDTIVDSLRMLDAQTEESIAQSACCSNEENTLSTDLEKERIDG